MLKRISPGDQQRVVRTFARTGGVVKHSFLVGLELAVDVERYGDGAAVVDRCNNPLQRLYCPEHTNHQNWPGLYQRNISVYFVQFLVSAH